MRTECEIEGGLGELELGGEVIQLGVVCGTVLDSQKHQELSHYLDGSLGSNQDPRYLAKSHVTGALVHDIWLQPDDGKEIHLRLTGVDLPLRKGHEVILLFGYVKGLAHEWLTLINRDTGTRHRLLKTSGFLKDCCLVPGSLTEPRRVSFGQMLQRLFLSYLIVVLFDTIRNSVHYGWWLATAILISALVAAAVSIARFVDCQRAVKRWFLAAVKEMDSRLDAIVDRVLE